MIIIMHHIYMYIQESSGVSSNNSALYLCVQYIQFVCVRLMNVCVCV